ncbi:hypothetical protein PSQ89_06635 [Pediococcus pentosaceus]|uniref:hypothetical protein n=1 Tax=Pediococcus pentosaceus TaxID=1255 RepID=UPI00235FB3DD|nr:hypothetical protein [Pediococcus pentosaceus]MDD1389863.1 hypothetical protein [Pediococcus pentosaceus]
MNKWSYDVVSTAQGKNDAAIEMFSKGAEGALGALVREDIQNSLDAVLDKSKPVRVEFRIGQVRDIPGKEGLLNIYRRIKDSKFWKHEYDSDIDKINNLLNEPKIQVLKISDYNTTGAKGASSYCKFKNSPWKAMTEISGETQKESSTSAGSFGIGKNANRAITPLQSLYFSSMAEGESEVYSQGWMIYASIVDESSDEITAKSYFYKDGETYKPIKGNFKEFSSLNPRKETGTDLYIPGANINVETAEEDITRAVLDNFLVAIYKKLLVVEIVVEDKETIFINSSNLKSNIESISNNESIESYFKALTQDDERYIFRMHVDNKLITNTDDVIFKVYQSDNQEKGTRRALLTRKIGMKINEYPDRGGAFVHGVDFSAVLLVLGDRQNELLHKIENPEHNNWNNVDKLNKVPEAKKLFNKIKKFMRLSIKELLPEVSDEVAAYGLEDMLVDNNGIKNNTELQVDKLPTEIAKVELVETIKPISRKKSAGMAGKNGNSPVIPTGKHVSDSSNTPRKYQKYPVYGGGTGQDYLNVTDSIKTLQIKYESNEYHVMIESTIDLIDPEIEFEIVGDSSVDTKINILNVETNLDSSIKIKRNTIKFLNTKVDSEKKFDIKFRSDVSGLASFNIKLLSQRSKENEN